MNIKYVQVESNAFFTDLDFVMMSAAERGVYLTLLLHLCCNGGMCRLDPVALAHLCNCEEFSGVWEKIAKKFKTRKGVIRHKSVTKELRRAKKLVQAKRRAGLASAAKRNRASTALEQPCDTESTKKRKGNEKEKEREIITNTNTNTSSSDQSLPSSSSVRQFEGLPADPGPAPVCQVEGVESIGAIVSRLGISAEAAAKAMGPTENPQPPDDEEQEMSRGPAFHRALTSIIGPRTPSDRTCFRNVADWMTRRLAEGRFTNDTFARVLGFADQAKSARNPAAAFMALLKKELRYPNG